MRTRAVDASIPNTVDHIYNNTTPRQSSALLDEWAQDLSGRYGGYYVKFEADRYTDELVITGQIYDPAGGPAIGRTTRTFTKDSNGKWSVHHDLLVISDSSRRDGGFSNAYYDTLIDYYKRSDLTHIDINAALQVGGYAWARRGFQWDTRHSWMYDQSVRSVTFSLDALIGNPSVSAGDKAKLTAIRTRLQSRTPPTPNEIATLEGDEPDPLGRGRANGLGARVMLGTNWHGILPLR